MQYYRKTPFDNLSIIQDKIFNFFPKDDLIFKRTNMWYPENSRELFLGIKELYDEFEKYNLIDEILYFAFFILQPTGKQGGPIHLDTGSFKYTLVIPIKGYVNTYVRFFETKIEPFKKDFNTVNYLKYNFNDCNLVDSVELNEPTIVKVKEPHDVLNPNKTYRITLLTRLKGVPASLSDNF